MELKSRRILLVGALPPPIHGLSLANKTFVDQACSLGHRVDVVDATGKAGDKAEMGKFRLSKVLGFLEVYAGLAKILSAEAVYVTPGQTFFGVLKLAPFMWLGRLLGRRVVFHLHGSALGRTYQGLTGIRRRLFAKAVGSCHAGIVLSRSLRFNFEELLPHEAIHAVGNFAGQACFDIQRTTPSAFSKENPLKLVFLSNLIPEKGAFVAMDAVTALRAEGLPIELDLAGAADPSIEPLVRARLGEGIRWHGVVSGEAKTALLASCNVLTLPTWYEMEGQPICILEGMAAGMPVVATRHAGIPDVLPDDLGLLMERPDPQELGTILRAFLASPALVAERGGQCRALASKDFTEAQFAAGILAVLFPG